MSTDDELPDGEPRDKPSDPAAMRAPESTCNAGVPAGPSAREAARRRIPLDEADVQALEGALTMTERERDEARAEVAELLEALASMRRQHARAVDVVAVLVQRAGGEVTIPLRELAALPRGREVSIRESEDLRAPVVVLRVLTERGERGER